MEYVFEGSISVKAVLLSGKREVFSVWIDEAKHDKDTSFLIAKAKEKGVEVKRVAREEIDNIAQGKTHGGVICVAGERTYESVEEVKGKQFLAILEGIEDPFNFGYCLRSLKAFGCEGILVNERNWYESAGVIAKSSAGASEYLSVVVVSDMAEVLKELKKEYKIVAANRRDAISLYEADFSSPVILAIGGEKRGLSRVVENAADQNVYIPYDSDFRNALNASSATSVFAYEIARAKRRKT